MSGRRTAGVLGGRVARAAAGVLPSAEKEMLLLPELVAPGTVCIDVGASYGLYTVALARLVGPGGVVVACEPRTRSRAVLRAAVRLLAPGNVVVVPYALGGAAGAATIVTPKRRWGPVPVPGRTFVRGELEAGDAGYYPGWAEEFGAATEQPVRSETLDRLVASTGVGRVGFVKIDVEGAELDVLAGAEETIGRDRPVVLCEVEQRHAQKYGHDASAVVSWLVARGYRPTRFDGRALVDSPEVDDGEINYVFLPG